MQECGFEKALSRAATRKINHKMVKLILSAKSALLERNNIYKNEYFTT
jgi:hypothetical protein